MLLLFDLKAFNEESKKIIAHLSRLGFKDTEQLLLLPTHTSSKDNKQWDAMWKKTGVRNSILMYKSKY